MILPQKDIDNMETNKNMILNHLYNLILNKATRDWERGLLSRAKNSIENGESISHALEVLEADLRPLASRENLTPDVSDFYLEITDQVTNNHQFDFSLHQISDFAHQDTAIFAGGCFWCMVEPFENRDGIISVLSGYTGGSFENPTYDQVIGGYTGHVESVEIIYDKRKISYHSLVDIYWQLIDPTDYFGQFQDRGNSYRSIIFTKNEDERLIAEESKQKLVDLGKYKDPIITEIRNAEYFWPAENYHQEFYKKHPKRYQKIKQGRNQLLKILYLKNKLHQFYQWINYHVKKS